MRLRLAILLIAALAGAPSSRLAAAGQAPAWDRWAFVVGEWVGEGSGNPGQGTARFSFAFDLDRRILVRKSHNEFPASAGRPAAVHDDLLIVYPEGSRTRAVYFDNEDHVIYYTLEPSTSLKALTLVSDTTAGAPRFRLVYSAAGDGTLRIRFDIAPPDKPDAFAAYLEGTARRVK
jgi:regulator of extracellular matrix RemA (YlzA/DUF370 family)